MKATFYIAAILILVASCKKQVQTVPQFTKPDYIELPEYVAAKKAEFLAKKNPRNPHNPPPTDTTTNPPPPIYIPHENYIQLDFDGGTLPQANVWGIASYLASGMNDEQIAITLERAREAFVGFNVIVDTSEARFDTFPAANRQKEIYTITWNWYGYAGGVAIKNSFGTETPCWVFTPNLSYNTHYIGEAGVHELGHTVNLPHQKDYTQPYCILNGEYLYGPWNMGCTYYYQVNGVWRDQSTPDCYNTINESYIIQQTLK